jgi:NAD(P)-dependent dehydrogenase (short-subunit alcohol dehydrogenase family)
LRAGRDSTPGRARTASRKADLGAFAAGPSPCYSPRSIITASGAGADHPERAPRQSRKGRTMSEIRFDGRVAVITGAGGGLGREYALLLASRGASIVVNDLGGSTDGSGASQSAADRTVGEIEAAGGKAIANYDTVSTPEGGEAIIKAALDAFGRVDILINNAGVLRDKTFGKMSPADLDVVVDVHLRGAFHVTWPAFRAMREKSYGRIVFTASAAGIFGNFGQANYGAAKMGLVGLSNVVAIEGAKYGIRCNTIAPIAKTRMTEELLGPLAEHVKPDLVAPLVAYLCSEQCEVTHEVYSVGGGRFARIFVGLTPGWFAGKGVVPTMDEVASHLGQIRDLEGYIVPDSIADEMRAVSRLFKS